jgi:hypothetical protein
MTKTPPIRPANRCARADSQELPPPTVKARTCEDTEEFPSGDEHHSRATSGDAAPAADFSQIREPADNSNRPNRFSSQSAPPNGAHPCP